MNRVDLRLNHLLVSDLVQVTSLLWSSVFSSFKWGGWTSNQMWGFYFNLHVVFITYLGDTEKREMIMNRVSANTCERFLCSHFSENREEITVLEKFYDLG